MSFDLKIVNGDVKVNASGDLEPVLNEEKLIQDILKAIFTSTGTHKLHPWYGSPLADNSIGTLIDPNVLNTIINNGVLYALSNIQTLQEMQSADGQYLTPKEILQRIDNVEVFQDEVDSRKLIIILAVTTRSGTRLEESFSVNL